MLRLLIGIRWPIWAAGTTLAAGADIESWAHHITVRTPRVFMPRGRNAIVQHGHVESTDPYKDTSP